MIHRGDDMKIAGAILALAGIIAVGLAAIQHFNHVIPSGSEHLSLIIGAAGVIALVLGAVLGRVGGGD